MDIIDRILVNEGGWVDDPDDAGGATNMGITLATFRKFALPNATKDDLRNMTTATARFIYQRQYIIAPGFDKIPDKDVQDILCDTGVLFGPTRAGEFLQQAINSLLTPTTRAKLTVDGKVGGDTLVALDLVNSKQVVNRIVNLRVLYHINRCKDVPSNIKFLEGWWKRAESFRLENVNV